MKRPVTIAMLFTATLMMPALVIARIRLSSMV